MEKRLNAKIDVWTTEFKGALAGKIQIMDMPDDTKAPLLQFIYDYAHLVVKKEDIQKRTRVKNHVPFHERCRALRANGEQCTRRKKDCAKFCGTHIKGIPHGEISDTESKESHLKKVQVWVQKLMVLLDILIKREMYTILKIFIKTLKIQKLLQSGLK